MLARLLLPVTILLFACGGTVGVDAERSAARNDDSINTGPVPEGCVKIEDSDIGVLPQDLGFVEVTSWTEKEGEPGEYVGLCWSGSTTVSVKYGQSTSWGEGSCWTSPDGHAISNVVFCEIDEPPAEEPPAEEPENEPAPELEADPTCTSHEDCPLGKVCVSNLCIAA